MNQESHNFSVPNGTIELRRTKLSDITQDWINYLNDQEAVKFLECRGKTHTIDSQVIWAADVLQAGDWLYTIELTTSDGIVAIVGSLTCRFSKLNRSVDLGIFIFPPFQRKAIGFRTWLYMLQFFYSSIEIRKISAGCMASNLAMKGLMEKCRMKEDGVRKAHFLQDNTPVDCLHYAIIK